jgi:hypothetical protein
MHIRRVSANEIARTLKLHPRTVRRAIERHDAELAIERNVAEERGRALAVYAEVQRAAWVAFEESRQRGRSGIMALSEVRQAQQEMDKLLGIVAPADLAGDPFLMLQQFQSLVISTVAKEAPELGPILSEKLLAARNGST